MKEVIHVLMVGFSIIVGVLWSALGGSDKLALALAVAMCIDYATGFLCAAVWHSSPKSATGGADSRAGLKGLFRKAGIVLCVYLAVQLSNVTGTPAIRDSSIIFFICNESLSIVENLGIMGVPFPPAIKNALEALKDKPPDTTAPEIIDADYTKTDD